MSRQIEIIGYGEDALTYSMLNNNNRRSKLTADLKEIVASKFGNNFSLNKSNSNGILSIPEKWNS